LQTIDRENEDGGANDSVRRKMDRRKREDGDMQLLFPEILRPRNDAIHNRNDGNDTTEKDKEDGKQMQSEHDQVKYTTKSVRSVTCILNLEKNGRFTLSLVEEDDTRNKHLKPFKPSPHMASHPIAHQQLTGEYYLTPNPYCVTDRHYDTLLLVSEPRMRRRSTMIEKATVEFRCKIWGRYSMGAIRKKIGLEHGRVRGRMSHGTIVIVKEEVKGSDDDMTAKLSTREVVGTFGGNAIVDLNSAGDDDNRTDGVIPEDDDDDDLDFDDNFDEFGVLRPITA